ncbi:MAG: Ig-like domain-containing protein, partial [Terriglobales bacterium]
HVDSIVVAPASVDCLSQDEMQQFTPQAFSGGNDVTATVGPFTWQSTSISQVTIDSDGLATAKLPGRSNIFASVAATNSTAVPFFVCPPAIITAHVPDLPDTTFTIAGTASQQLAADVVDTKGKTLTGVPLQWTSSLPAVATVDNNGLVRGVIPGTTVVSASCTPPSCNPNTTLASHSNATVATVTGSTVPTAAFATCTSTADPCTTATSSGTQTPLVSIGTSGDTIGTTLQLPNTPNSLVLSNDGLVAFLGSSGGLMIVNATNTTLDSTVTNAPGMALAANTTGSRVIISDIATSRVFILDRSANTLEILNIAGATRAAFTPDGFKAFILASNTLHVHSPQLTLRTIALGASAADLDILAGGSFVYLAGGAASALTAHATCDNSLAETLATPGTPSLVASLPDGNTVLAVDSPGIDVVSVVPDLTAGCPGLLADTVNQVDFGQGAFTALQMIVLADGSRAYVTSDLADVLVYDVAGGTTTNIPLVGGAVPTTGGATIDSTRVYVGGSDNAVHRIDVDTGTDSVQIPLTFTPDLVGVRPR